MVKRVYLECNIPQRTETAVRCGRPRSVWPDLYGAETASGEVDS